MKKALILFSIAALFVLFSSCYAKPFPMEGFNSYKSSTKDGYDYVKNTKILSLKSGNLELEVTTKRKLEWSEVDDLFCNNIAPFLRGDVMMKRIIEIWGSDPVKAQYPMMIVNICFKSGTTAVQFESSYYNTPDMTNITEDNIQEYTKWNIHINREQFPNAPDIKEYRFD